MAVETIPRYQRGTLANALVITRREVRDNLRDWRIVTPIVILTVIFPFLMDFTSRWATNWVSQFTDPILVERLNPFLLMIVGFFPISFSLIIALESFVGEKERNSIEPILSMPLSDLELYLGKMLSSLLLPLGAAYLGITVFLTTRILTNPPWIPPLELAVLMIMLTTFEALVMVSGAVVISSQTTSVRAANLLASFIIIPVALLIQLESVVMFYAEYRALWWFVLGLAVVTVILIRMGIKIFNREDILSRELDELHIKTIWRDFKYYFSRPPDALNPSTKVAKFTIWRVYTYDLPRMLQVHRLALGVVLIGVIAAIIMGAWLAFKFPLPPGTFSLDDISEETFEQVQQVRLLPTISTTAIFVNNARVLILAAVLSVFSFGSLALILTFLNIGLVSFIITEVVLVGLNPLVFIASFILPHGIFEIPALILGLAFALRIGASIMSPPPGLNVGQSFLLGVADYTKIMLFLVIPLLLLAAFIEANITPEIVLTVYGVR
jgi:uncharacterized membrane protein SpoIIM required for sporulation/ABC-type transport system involved in multi-copper enzyme maturation permease subunit